MEPTQIDGGVPDFVLTDVHDIVEVRLVCLLGSQIIVPFS